MESPEKKYGGPDRIVGTDEKTEAYLKLVQAKQILKEQELSAFEREPTQEEKEIIFEVFDRLPDFIKEYGASQERFTDFKQVHILDDHIINQDEKIKSFFERNIDGRYSPSTGRIEILQKESNYMRMAHALVHELMHANSFFSITLKKDDEGTEQNLLASLRRFGISSNEKCNIGNMDKQLFNFMNETVTEELTKRFCERYFPEMRLLKDRFTKLKGTRTQIELLDSPTVAILSELLDSQSLYSYINERADFVSMVELLYETNKDEFNSYEDVFKLFSKTMFQGHLLPIARLIEKTFGKGSFRTLGQKTKERSPDVADTLSDIYPDTNLIDELKK